MLRNAKRGSALASCLALVGCLALGACGTSKAAGSSGPLIVEITPNPVGTDQFLNLGVLGIKQAAAKYHGSEKVFQSTDPTTMAQNLQAALRMKPAVIVVIGFEWLDLMSTAPAQNPRQQFLLIDSCVPHPAKNLSCASFREYEAVFLAGAEAGLLTKTDKVGGVISINSAQIMRYSTPFGQGAEYVNKKVHYTPLFVGGNNPFSDPARASAQAKTLTSNGADYIMAAAAAGNTGVFQAAKSAGAKTFGVDINECPESPGTVVDNVVKHTNVVEVDSIGKILHGKTGQVRTYGLAENGMGLTGLDPGAMQSQCLIAKYPSVIQKVLQLRQAIINHQIKIYDPEVGKAV
jgi:basic membrane protein A and related proteins